MNNNNHIDKNLNIKIYINGDFYNRDEAKISVFDSFLLGDGIWEGIRLVKNEWLFLNEHLDRLFEGQSYWYKDKFYKRWDQTSYYRYSKY